MTLTERILAVRERFESHEIAIKDKDGEDSVWCGETSEHGYIGWCKRGYAEEMGYKILWTTEDTELLGVLDACLVLATKEEA
jgi:hypothetical protein